MRFVNLRKETSVHGYRKGSIKPSSPISSKAIPLVFEILKTAHLKSKLYRFTISIIEEKTLQWMEQRHPGKLQTDGRHYFLTFDVEVEDPNNLKDELIHKFVLDRIRGDN